MLQMKAGDVSIVVLEPMNLVKLQEGTRIELDLTNPMIFGPDCKKVVLWFAQDKGAFLAQLREAGIITPDTKDGHPMPPQQH